MPKNFQRTERVGDLIQTVLAQLIQREVKDPRVAEFVTITGVQVSRDLAHAKVFFTVHDENQKLEKTLEGLEQAKGFLRGRLAEEVQLRITPDLHFHYDETLTNARRMDDLLRGLVDDE